MLKEDYATMQRHLAIEGTHNVRDMGGYTTRDGSHTRWRTLLRADKLDRISAEGQQTLVDYGIRTVIDLRYTPEIQSEPDSVSTSRVIHYLPMPLYELKDDGALPAVPDDLESLNRLILDNRQAQIVSIFRAMFAPGALPALFHCTAGKDRTGLIAALVLGAIDVPDETIVEDYALSAQYLNQLLDELRVQAKRMGFDGEWYERLLQCRPEIMRHTLEYAAANYGSIPGYLLKAGLTQSELNQIRRALVE